MCPNPIVHVPIRNRIVQVQSEQAASRGVVRISTHNREGHSPRVRSYLAYYILLLLQTLSIVLKENLFFQRSPNPIGHVPKRNRRVQVQSEQAASRGVGRTSTHNRDTVVAMSVAPPLPIAETSSATSIVD